VTTEFVFPPVPDPDAPPMPDPMPDPIPDPDMPDPMPEPVPPVRRGGAGTVPLRFVLAEDSEPGDEPVEPLRLGDPPDPACPLHSIHHLCLGEKL